MANNQPSLPVNSARDPNFYYTVDGNIVLSAVDATNCIIYFRLHQSILSAHSPVFAGMFGVPPPSRVDTYDGVPLVEMPDDADALRTFIALLYEPQCISVILKGEDFAARMFEPVVLARKYQVDWIRTMVASHLEHQWPLTLAGWDRIANAEVTVALAGEDPESWEPDDSLKLHRLPEPVTAIRLARECDVPAVLPLAFLHLLRQPLEVDPGSLNDLHATVWQAPERGLLAPEDLDRLFLARERMGKWFSYRPVSNWGPCESGKPCETTRLRTRCTIATNVARDGNVLAASQWILQNGMLSAGICPLCSMRCRDEIREMREQFFGQLGTFFQL
ncbi:hypothetical protein FB451DRAFT_1017706 [Mycena latifolia]|nr:hypothetical protein FB451DRAFT_1017706 [Mycena latifolia]